MRLAARRARAERFSPRASRSKQTLAPSARGGEGPRRRSGERRGAEERRRSLAVAAAPAPIGELSDCRHNPVISGGPSFPINGFVFRRERFRPRVKLQADVKTASCAIPEPFVRDLNFRRECGCTARSPREPVRDWRLGWMTGHRARVIVFTVSMIAILLASHSLSPAGRPPRTLVEEIASWASLLWLGALLPGSLGLIGTLLYQFPSDLDDIRTDQQDDLLAHRHGGKEHRRRPEHDSPLPSRNGRRRPWRHTSSRS